MFKHGGHEGDFWSIEWTKMVLEYCTLYGLFLFSIQEPKVSGFHKSWPVRMSPFRHEWVGGGSVEPLPYWADGLVQCNKNITEKKGASPSLVLGCPANTLYTIHTVHSICLYWRV